MNLGRIVARNVRRSTRNFVMSGVGIVVGVATLVFFVGLGEGIKDVVLGKVFIIDQVEVVPKRYDTGFGAGSLLGIGGGAKLDDGVVQAFTEVEGVSGVFPKMKLTFPTRASGGKRLLGRDMWAEIIADGIEPSLVTGEMENPEAFQDYESQACADDKACGDGRTCEEGVCRGVQCTYDKRDPGAVCPGDRYCAEDTQRCEVPIPILVSNHLLELYNSNLATAMSGGTTKLPKLSKTALVGFGFKATFGRSFLGRAKQGNPVERRVKLVGFSDRAISVGVTMPIAYVKRLNARFSGEAASETYHSAILKAADQGAVAGIAQRVKQMGFELADKTNQAEKAGMLITIITVVFSLISVIIVGIAAVNIGHTFYMLIYQRKREIGVLRAIGGSRNDVRRLILGEAALIGLFGGTVGLFGGLALAAAADAMGGTYLPDFPYKPETFFLFPTWLWPTAVAFAVLFCLLGAFFPANAAARMEPAEALAN